MLKESSCCRLRNCASTPDVSLACPARRSAMARVRFALHAWWPGLKAEDRQRARPPVFAAQAWTGLLHPRFSVCAALPIADVGGDRSQGRPRAGQRHIAHRLSLAWRMSIVEPKCEKIGIERRLYPARCRPSAAEALAFDSDANRRGPEADAGDAGAGSSQCPGFVLGALPQLLLAQFHARFGLATWSFISGGKNTAGAQGVRRPWQRRAGRCASAQRRAVSSRRLSRVICMSIAPQP